jgi:hypothetical protein
MDPAQDLTETLWDARDVARLRIPANVNAEIAAS